MSQAGSFSNGPETQESLFDFQCKCNRNRPAWCIGKSCYFSMMRCDIPYQWRVWCFDRSWDMITEDIFSIFGMEYCHESVYMLEERKKTTSTCSRLAWPALLPACCCVGVLEIRCCTSVIWEDVRRWRGKAGCSGIALAPICTLSLICKQLSWDVSTSRRCNAMKWTAVHVHEVRWQLYRHWRKTYSNL